MINLPKPPETWSESEITLYSRAIPHNYRSQRSINPYATRYHVICEDNRIRAFTPYKHDTTRGSVQYEGKRVRGWVESTDIASFFYGDDMLGNGDIPFDHMSKILRHRLEMIEDQSRT